MALSPEAEAIVESIVAHPNIGVLLEMLNGLSQENFNSLLLAITDAVTLHEAIVIDAEKGPLLAALAEKEQELAVIEEQMMNEGNTAIAVVNASYAEARYAALEQINEARLALEG